MSVPQQELLGLLSRSSAPSGVEDIDGRSAKALVARGFARHTDDAYIQITDAGREAYQKLSEPQAQRRRGRPRQEHPRAEAILRVVGKLEQAVPRDSELLVGPILAHIDDVLHGFRRYARELKRERKSSPG